MTTFEFKMPKEEIVAKAVALVVTADGTGTVIRKRQVDGRIIDRFVPVSGVLATKACPLAPVMEELSEAPEPVEGADPIEAPEPKVLGYHFDDIDAKMFKLAGGKATSVPKIGHVDLDIPDDFVGSIVVKAEIPGKKEGETASALVSTIEVGTPKEE